MVTFIEYPNNIDIERGFPGVLENLGFSNFGHLVSIELGHVLQIQLNCRQNTKLNDEVVILQMKTAQNSLKSLVYLYMSRMVRFTLNYCSFTKTNNRLTKCSLTGTVLS